MREIKTAELIGPALDYAVAVAVGEQNPKGGLGGGGCVVSHGHTLHRYCPSTEWSHGGPLLDLHGISLGRSMGFPFAFIEGKPVTSRSGKTTLIAACRAIVAAKLGDTVQIPDDLA